MIDTTLVQPVTDLVTKPEISEWIIAGLISLIVTITSYLVGVFKIPKDNVIKFLRFAALIFGAIIQAQYKNWNPEKNTKATIQGYKLADAVTTIEQGVLSSEHKSFFQKAVKLGGGIVPIVNWAVPLIKPFIKGKK